MLSDVATSLLQPPAPPIPAGDLSPQGLLKAIRRNALEIWPARAYEQEDDNLYNFFGHSERALMNAPGESDMCC